MVDYAAAGLGGITFSVVVKIENIAEVELTDIFLIFLADVYETDEAPCIFQADGKIIIPTGKPLGNFCDVLLRGWPLLIIDRLLGGFILADHLA
jgi:hypothetical protein